MPSMFAVLLLAVSIAAAPPSKQKSTSVDDPFEAFALEQIEKEEKEVADQPISDDFFLAKDVVDIRITGSFPQIQDTGTGNWDIQDPKSVYNAIGEGLPTEPPA